MIKQNSLKLLSYFMKKKDLVIINNEKVFFENVNFYCDNLDLKIVPEGLNKEFEVTFLVRKSSQKGGQKIDLQNIKPASNIFEFILNVFRTFKKKSKYLIISITPYTFISFLILFIFRKKIYLYLWSDGHEEWKHILGKWSVWIYHIMFLICTFGSELIVCNKRLANKKHHLISISRLDPSWFQNLKNIKVDKVRFLYVGRLSEEKGIFDFIKMLEKIELDYELSIAGYANKYTFENKKIKLLGYISNSKDLIKTYDEHNITILPSYTEGYPYVVDESLARKRPVIIFKEISYVVNQKKGIFISERNSDALQKTTSDIVKNYNIIQEEMKKNNLPTKDSMLRQISNIIGV